MNIDDIKVRMGFVLLPQFTLGAFAAFTDLLGLLNAGTEDAGPCVWEVVADTLIPVRSASGVQVVPTGLLGDPQRFDYVLVVGGPFSAPPEYSPELLAWIRDAARGDRHLLGLCNGVFALAQAGVMAGHRVCVPNSLYREFMQRFPAFAPDQVVVDRTTVIDRRRITCTGGAATADLAVRILRRHVSDPDVQRAFRRLQMEAAESAYPIQPPPADLPADCPAAVQRAVLLIEQYAGNALSLSGLSDRLGLSPRQLQRLFKQHLDTTPQAYARRVRLRMADWMLVHTDGSLAAIASDCGFADAAHMSRAFQAVHGSSPGAWRRRSRASRLPRPREGS
ncbi:Transcriptional regulator GlxA family with amidase domain OS=Castellaniella defragrans OX=75697 GN=HNR28_002980 PE=4 SV=1 [Castellaniella defragrans]